MAAGAALALAFVGLMAAEPALAQAKNPFSVGISEGGGGTTGVMGWILAQQGFFERSLAAAVRASRADGSALWWLGGLSFVYGVLHAAGPGHGKAVLASYMVANERALRRGIVLSFFAALLQATVAVALVGVLSLVFHATATGMREGAAVIEKVSYSRGRAPGFLARLAQIHGVRDGVARASEQRADARQGWLRSNGRRDGPWPAPLA